MSGILGGGLIGCGWAVAFAGAGHKTVVIDPDPATEDRLAATWSTGRPVVERLGQLSPCRRTSTMEHNGRNGGGETGAGAGMPAGADGVED
jgi:3-hydroxyacyl-CoA dehydrogenase